MSASNCANETLDWMSTANYADGGAQAASLLVSAASRNELYF
jgi:hypothetical protein